MTYESIETRVYEGVFSLVITPSVGPEIVVALPGDAPLKIARMLLWESGHKYMDIRQLDSGKVKVVVKGR